MHCTYNVNIRHNILHKYRAVTTANECSVVNLRYKGTSFYTKIANSSIFHESEEAAPLRRYLIIIVMNGVSGTIEDTVEGPVFRAYHQTRICAFVQVYVVCQKHFQLCIALLNLEIEPIQLLGAANKIVAIGVLTYCIGVGHAANYANPVCIILVVGYYGIAFSIAIRQRIVC